MRFELDKLAFALTAYQADVGSFAKLRGTGRQLRWELPKDRFNEADLHYRAQGAVNLPLYSVGINGKDDQGEAWKTARSWARTGMTWLSTCLRPQWKTSKNGKPRYPR